MSEHLGNIPELAPGEVFVNRETYEQDMPGRVSSEDVLLDFTYTCRGLTGSKLDAYYAAELPVRVTLLTRLNDTDYEITLEHVIPDDEQQFYEPQTGILRDGMLIHASGDAGTAREDQATQAGGYLMDRDQAWDVAFRQELAELELSTAALASAVQ